MLKEKRAEFYVARRVRYYRRYCRSILLAEMYTLFNGTVLPGLRNVSEVCSVEKEENGCVDGGRYPKTKPKKTNTERGKNTMKKFFKNIKDKVNGVAIRVKAAIETKKAELYVDKGVGIIIAVVVGTAIMAGIYTLFKTTIIPNMNTKVSNLWTYAG